MRPVFKEWLLVLPYRMQSVLVSALRGCDTARKDDPSKFITRGLRTCILNDADPTNTFMGPVHPEERHVSTFLWDLDSYPLHFVMHTAHAAEIVGYKHPDEDVRSFWVLFYENIVKALHMNPEAEAQLDVRLGFTPVELEGRRKALLGEHKWDAGTGTSHGDRDRPWSGGS